MEDQPSDQGGEVVDFSKRRAERDRELNASVARHPAGRKKDVYRQGETGGDQETVGDSPVKKGHTILRAAEVELTDGTDDKDLQK